MVQGPMLIVILVCSVLFIVVMTAKVRLNAFIVLLLAAFGVGLFTGLPLDKITGAIRNGFGGTLGYIGIVIIAGTIIGTILEKTGAALSMANCILRIVGKKRADLAVSIAGYIVSIPVFCDSGFVILTPLNKALAERTKRSMAVMGTALATGLYATHVFVPPTPGPIAAAGLLGADLGRVILLGLIVSVPAMLIGWVWARKIGGKFDIEAKPEFTYDELIAKYGGFPNAAHSFAPLVIPILLIALKSVAAFPTHPFGTGTTSSIIQFIGDPVTALLIGVFIALSLVKKWNEEVLRGWIGHGIVNAAVILAITGAGGSFGQIIKTTPIGDYLGNILAPLGLGIFLPFIIAAALKTAQGSSTVAMITTPAIIGSLLPMLGLAGPWGRVLTVLAIGAGAMTVSHANDSYFWVVSRFSGMDVPTAYKVYTTATLVLGLVSMAVIAIMAVIIL